MVRTTTAAVAALVLALAGCGQDTGQTPTADADTPAATGNGGGAAQTCEEAFAQVDPDDAAEAIEQSSEALDDTIRACDSVEAWMEEAGSAFGVTEEEGREFIGARCQANPELAHIDACAEPTSS